MEPDTGVVKIEREDMGGIMNCITSTFGVHGFS